MGNFSFFFFLGGGGGGEGDSTQSYILLNSVY